MKKEQCIPVTAVMITGKHDGRRWLARSSLASFLQQTYPNKRLLIINDSGKSWFDDVSSQISYPSVREIVLKQRKNLGELRNVALNEVTDGLLIQWDDDDWSHPDRITYQVRHFHGSPVTLRWQCRYSFQSDLCFEHRYGWTKGRDVGTPGTVLHGLSAYQYREMDRREDSLFLLNFPEVTVIENAPGGIPGPDLYIRFHHGENTWSGKHIMGSRYGHLKRWDASERTRIYLRSVLDAHYNQQQHQDGVQ